MLSRLSCVLALVFFVSCNDKIKFLLPLEYSLSKKQEITSFPDKIAVYDVVDKHIEYAKIKSYPNYDKVDYSSQKWINIHQLDERNKKHINLIIEEILERINKENKDLAGLANIFDDKKEVYFSGIYQKTKAVGNRTYNFYDTFNILDVNESRLYRIEYIKDY